MIARLWDLGIGVVVLLWPLALLALLMSLVETKVKEIKITFITGESEMQNVTTC